jgi:ribonuclease HI
MQSNTGKIRQIYTDGGCHNGPDGPLHGVGSWAFLEPADLSQGYVDIYGGYVEGSTNNITEMLAVLNGIKYLRELETYPNCWILSDSGYIVTGYTNPAYLDRWLTNGWKTSANKPVLNRGLWEELLALSYHTALNFTLIKGHNKDKNPIHAFWNDICDKACTYIMSNLKYTEATIKLRYDLNSKKFTSVDLDVSVYPEQPLETVHIVMEVK